MKKLIVVLLVVGIAGGLYITTRNKEVEVKTPASLDGSTKPDASNATFEFDDGPIKLTAGRSEKSIVEGSDLKEEITLSDSIAYGDLNNDKKNDAGVIIVRSGGGSGVFVYVASFVSGLVNYKGSNAVFLGDRISPESISIANGVLTVKYLDRSPEEPLAAEPTLEVTKEFTYSSGTLVER